MRAVLRQREFRLLWAGQAASVLGDRLVLVALALFVTDFAGPTELGLVLAAQFVPFVGLLLFGGVWADRLPRQRLIVATDLVRLACHALLAALIFTGAVEVWHIVAIEIVFGAAMAFFQPAYSGLLPQTVPEALIQEAQAVTAVTRTASSFLGPAIATALVLGLGAGWAFALDAATFGVSAVMLMRLRPRERGVRAARASTFHELREGWGAFVANTWVWAIVASAATAMLFAIGPWQTLGPTVGEDRYDSPGYYGVAMTAFGLGALIGSLVAGGLRPRYPMRVAHLVVMPNTLVIVLFVFGAPFALVFAAFMIGGAGVSVFAVLWETALAERIPPHLLSRVSAYDWMGSMAFVPIGYALAGPAAEAFGATEVLVFGVAVALVVDLLVLPAVWNLQSLEKSGTPESVVEASA